MKKKEKQKNCKIKITLHHDYLKIIDERDTKNIESIQIPIRTAKLIHDMWEVSNSNENDIKEYAVGRGAYSISNPEFETHTYIRNVSLNNELQWNTKIIKKI